MIEVIYYSISCNNPRIYKEFANKESALVFLEQVKLDYPNADITGYKHTRFINNGNDGNKPPFQPCNHVSFKDIAPFIPNGVMFGTGKPKHFVMACHYFDDETQAQHYANSLPTAQAFIKTVSISDG
ncbi:hypothetical protein LU293_07340 [Moraxella nasovis]|uniref:hypothetical protein n=1 Tax=Moraxella nasovis TaxID=2904121 RepID=UPI001F606ADC|nr:hypothetical protein [Moraxella nasovis]UNU72901.1 hypothetical protein LU293_07340 [Moraxella nasovis]